MRRQPSAHLVRAALSALVFLFGMVRHCDAANIEFTKIADGSTLIPGTSDTFFSFGFPANGRAGVVFNGDGTLFANAGIFADLGNGIEVIANRAAATPDGSGTFVSFRNSLQTASGFNTAFVASSSDRGTGIYALRGGTLETVVDQSTSLPGGGGTFGLLNIPSISGVNLAFADSQAGQEAVYADFGAGLFTVADTSMQVPGGTGTVLGIGSPRLSGTNLLISLSAADGQSGLYADFGSGLAPVVTQNTLAPGTNIAFDLFQTYALSGNNVAFFGSAADPGEFQQGIYADFGSGLEVIADLDTPDPDGTGTIGFFSFTTVSISGEIVAFNGADSEGRRAIFAWVDGKLLKVLGGGDMLDGKQVEFVAMGLDAVAGNRIAIEVDFLSEDAIYVATVPEPSAACLTTFGVLGILAMPLSRRRRREA